MRLLIVDVAPKLSICNILFTFSWEQAEAHQSTTICNFQVSLFY